MFRSLGWWGRKPSRPNWLGEFLIIIYELINERLILLAAGMEAPLSLPSSPVSVRPLHLLLLLILTIAILTLLLFSYGAFPSCSILNINYEFLSTAPHVWTYVCLQVMVRRNLPAQHSSKCRQPFIVSIHFMSS